MGKNLFQKYQNLIRYLVFNWIATLINFIIYWLLADVGRWNYLFSNGVAWFGGILTAYIFNRFLVFQSRSDGLRTVAGEFVLYFICRIFSGIADMLVLVLCVEQLHVDDFAGKLMGALVAFFINYIVSKWLVFRKMQPVIPQEAIDSMEQPVPMEQMVGRERETE